MYVIEIVVNLVESFLIAVFYKYALTPQKPKRQQCFFFWTYVTTNTILVSIVNFFTLLESFHLILYIVSALIYIFLCFKENYAQKIFIAIVPFYIIIFSSITTSILVTVINDTTLHSVLIDDSMTRIFSLIIAKILQFIITIILITVINKYISSLKTYHWISFFLIFLMTVFCGVFVFNMEVSTDEKFEFQMYLCSIISLILINVLIFIIFVIFSKRNTELMNYKINETLVNEKIIANQEIDEAYKKLIKLRHDMKDQYICITNLILDENFIEAENYLKSLTGFVNTEIKAIQIINTSSRPLNAIINHFIRHCKQNDMHFKYEVTNINFGKIEDYILCSLISNLLNNAFEASQKINKDKSFIKIEMLNKANYLVCIVRNKIELSVLDVNINLETTKKDKNNHGLGIKIIKDISNKYDGITNFREENGEFVAEIWLKIDI